MSEGTEALLPVEVNDPSIFSADYYLRGEELGLSGYSDYKWMADPTLHMAIYMKRYMGIKDGSSVYEFGAARGFLVKALRMLSVNAWGYDVSEWAVENCDEGVKNFMSAKFDVAPMSYDHVVAKDVMEHLSKEQLEEVLPKLLEATRKSMLIIVPLASDDNGPYLCPRDEGDITHKIRWTLGTWLKFLGNIDRRCVCCGSLYVPGIKEANVSWEGSCGFFKIARM